ncbi:MAG TPA: branched-chain amino acid ABC transporter permease [Arenicellales bacterium]|nr:branched-chain amino acid ABC transporter permease [Arenicellales bacterium]
MQKPPGRYWLVFAAVLVLLLAPAAIAYLDQPFYLDVLMRLMILAIAASSLNLILGYSGMISLGHSVYIGIGAYAVGIPAYYDQYNGLLQLALALGGAGLFALVTGLICLRTRGAYFIMITLAFAQMMYFTFVSIEEYGGDDGLVIYARSDFAGLYDLENNVRLYYLVLGCLLLTLLLVHRIVNSHFGMVIRGAKSNDRRMQAVGFPTFRYRLTCYVISGMICGLAGWLMGNFTGFISPEMMDWTRSGELIAMVILGGPGSLFGPAIGAAVFILMETVLAEVTIYWHLYLGLLLILVAKFGRGGLGGLFQRNRGTP